MWHVSTKPGTVQGSVANSVVRREIPPLEEFRKSRNHNLGEIWVKIGEDIFFVEEILRASLYVSRPVEI